MQIAGRTKEGGLGTPGGAGGCGGGGPGAGVTARAGAGRLREACGRGAPCCRVSTAVCAPVRHCGTLAGGAGARPGAREAVGAKRAVRRGWPRRAHTHMHTQPRGLAGSGPVRGAGRGRGRPGGGEARGSACARRWAPACFQPPGGTVRSSPPLGMQRGLRTPARTSSVLLGLLSLRCVFLPAGCGRGRPRPRAFPRFLFGPSWLVRRHAGWTGARVAPRPPGGATAPRGGAGCV